MSNSKHTTGIVQVCHSIFLMSERRTTVSNGWSKLDRPGPDLFVSHVAMKTAHYNSLARPDTRWLGLLWLFLTSTQTSGYLNTHKVSWGKNHNHAVNAHLQQTYFLTEKKHKQNKHLLWQKIGIIRQFRWLYGIIPKGLRESKKLLAYRFTDHFETDTLDIRSCKWSYDQLCSLRAWLPCLNKQTFNRCLDPRGTPVGQT